jgi:amidase
VTGLVGLKPTVGVVSRDGIIPISISQDTAGPMGRTVSDVALLMTALAGVDASDPAGPAAEGKIPADYTPFLEADALKGRRFGLLRQAMGFHPGVDDAIEAAVAAMKGGGAQVIEVKIATLNDWQQDEFEVQLYEFKDGLNAYLKEAGSPHGSLDALIAWNRLHAGTVMPFFGQEIFERARSKGPLTDEAYRRARDRARRLAGPDGLLQVLAAEKLDAVIAPSTSPAWPTDHVLGDHFVGAGYGMAAVAGTPSITVPIGESFGLPIGLTFMGRAYSESQLIAVAYALEQAVKARKPPEYQPTLH